MLNFLKNKRKLKYIIVTIIIVAILLLSSILFTIISIRTQENDNAVKIAKATEGYSSTNPYIPEGFTHSEGTLDTGFVIKESSTGNEFVWVPVNGTNLKLKRSNFSKSFSIINPDSTQEDILEEPSFNVSVGRYGGFYVGRYEAGINPNNADIPVCKKESTVWTNISRDNAKASAEKMYESNKEVISSLMNSYAYDTMLTWLKTKNYNVDDDSSSWGNYKDNSNGNGIIQKSGAKDNWKANNIYDIAGNVWEWTTENCGNDAVVRGGDALSNGSVLPAGTRDHAKSNSAFSYTGFRVLLYRDVNYTAPIPETTLVVAGGVNHTAFLDKNKTLWMWGKNSNGELGDSTTTLQKMPKHINASIKFKKISLSRGQAEFTDSNGFSVGIDVDGFLYTWGYNGYGQLGTGNTTKVTSLQKITVKLNNTDVKFQKVSAGQSHCLAIDLDGNLWAWGSGADYRLGTGNTTSVKTPTKITSNIIFKEISASNFHNMALDKDDNLYTWGSKSNYKLCTGSTSAVKTPTKVTKTTNKFKKIAAGQQNSFAIDTNGYLWGCGSNYAGRLGIGDTTSDTVTELKQIAPDKKFKDISTHGNTAMAIDTNGFLWGWGENKYSQLGTDKKVTPVAIKPISIPIGKKIQKISVGRHYFIAIDEEEKVWVCGLNTKNGTLGNNSTQEVTTPIKININ